MNLVPDHVFHTHILPRLKGLEAFHFARCRRVCKRWKRIFTHDTVWLDFWKNKTKAPSKNKWTHNSTFCLNLKCRNWNTTYPNRAPPPPWRCHFNKDPQPMYYTLRDQVRRNYFKACFLYRRPRICTDTIPLLCNGEMDSKPLS